MRALVLILSLQILPAFAVIETYEFESEALQERYLALSAELRCPKCQNQSISDSDAGIAQDMRTRVHSMILEGRSDDEIVDYFVSRYGDFVSYRPPVNAQTSVLWLVPLILLGGGGLLIVMLLRHASAKANDDEGDAS